MKNMGLCLYMSRMERTGPQACLVLSSVIKSRRQELYIFTKIESEKFILSYSHV